MKHAKCPPTDAYTHKFGLSIQCNIYCLVIKRIQQWMKMIHVTTWMKLTNIMLYEKSQIKGHRVHDFICKKHITRQTHRNKKQIRNCQELSHRRARMTAYEQRGFFYWNDVLKLMVTRAQLCELESRNCIFQTGEFCQAW